MNSSVIQIAVKMFLQKQFHPIALQETYRSFSLLNSSHNICGWVQCNIFRFFDVKCKIGLFSSGFNLCKIRSFTVDGQIQPLNMMPTYLSNFFCIFKILAIFSYLNSNQGCTKRGGRGVCEPFRRSQPSVWRRASLLPAPPDF